MKFLPKIACVLSLFVMTQEIVFSQGNTFNNVRNIAFFYAESDSLKLNSDSQWSACAQLIYMRNDSVFDQIFLVDQIPESPYSTSNKIDLKIVQFILNFDNSFNKGVFAVNYKKIKENNDFFSIKPISSRIIERELKKYNEPTLIKIYYYKKSINSIDENVIIQMDQVILKVVWKEEPFAREYVLASPSTNKEQKVKVLIL